MKYRAWIQLVIFFCCATRALTASAVDCKTLSHKLLDNLDQGNYAAAGGDFNDKMKTLSPEKLQQVWQVLPEKMGARGSREEARVTQSKGYDVVTTPMHYGNKIANAVVACSADGKIAGFHIQPQ